MLAVIQQTLTRCRLDRTLRKAVLAISGGSDSIALLLALRQLWEPNGVVLLIVHVHHNLRGNAADEDAEFVRKTAQRLHLPFILERVDVPAACRTSGDSLEMAARKLRWAALRRIAQAVNADAICTGHTADDQIETLFLRLARGTGPRGLGGIAPCSTRRGEPLVLRPLLDCRRAALRAWLQTAGMPWREDETNRDPSIPRNRTRASLLPAFEQALGPQAVESALRTLALMREEEEEWLSPIVREQLESATFTSPGGDALDCRRLQTLPRPLARRVLLAWLQRQDYPAPLQTLARLDSLAAFALAPEAGSRRLSLGDGKTAQRLYHRLELVSVTPPPQALPEVRLSIPGTVASEAWGLQVIVTHTHGALRPCRRHPLSLPQSATLSVASVGAQELTLRPIRPGDRIRPIGLGGSRKLSDLLIDRKIPRPERPKIPVIACGNAVAWLPGVCVSADHAVPDAQSPALRVTIRHRPARDGFTLVEVLVALALAGLVLVPAVLSLQRLLHAEARLATTLRAELSARRTLSEVEAAAGSGPERIPETRVTLDPTGALRTVVRHARAKPDSPAHTEVTVSNAQDGLRPVLRLSRALLPPTPPPTPPGAPP